jgi:hypothetical protein
MKPILRLFTMLLCLGANCVIAEEKSPAAVPAKSGTADTSKEEQFKTAIKDVTFKGRWCPVENGNLGPEKEDSYQIAGADKSPEGAWTIRAKMKYGEQEFEIPIPVKVEWAGDTPVIIVNNLAMPGGGKYTARVLIHNGTYAGTWSGGDQVGLLSGLIVKKTP